MYQKYSKFENVLFIIEKTVVMIAFALIFVTVVLQVFQRFLKLPIPDTTDLSVVSHAVFAFISVGMLFWTGGHITIEVHKMIKNKNLLFMIEMVMYGISLVFAGTFIYLGWDLFSYAFEGGSATMAMRIPLWIPYGSMLIGLILMVINVIGRMMKMVYCKKNGLDFEDEIDLESMR